MKINQARNLPNTNLQKFKGLNGNDKKSMFVFDLDGTLATSSSEDIKYIQDKVKDCNAKLVYATGRSFLGVLLLQGRLLRDFDINLPTPDYLISDDGQYLYEKKDGLLKEDENYRSRLKKFFNFSDYRIADKATGVTFIKKKEHVNYNEILMAGNDNNDLPMARLSLKGSKFICMNNSAELLKTFCFINPKNIFQSESHGSKSLTDGIDYFTKSK